MLSKKRFNYQAKLFFPIAGTLCLFAIGLGLFHYQRGVKLREDALRQDIDHITAFIKQTYESTDIRMGYKIREQYLQFIDTFYVNTDLDDISINVIDNETGNQVVHSGSIFIPPPTTEDDGEESMRLNKGTIEVSTGDEVITLPLDKAFYYKKVQTDDGKYTIQALMPYYTDSSNSLFSVGYLVVLYASTLVMVFLIYIYTAHISKNVVSLGAFVNKVARGEEPDYNLDFANDELGETARQVLDIYESRQRAFEEIENEHQIALKATEEKNTVRQQLTNNINHELKTPIGILQGYLETIAENPDMDEQTRSHFIRNCCVQVKRLTDMVTDLSMMARLENGVSNIPTEKLDMCEIVNSAKFDLTESGMAGEMMFESNVPEGTYVRGNFNLLNNMIANLAKNAVAYSGGTKMGINLVAKNRRFYSFCFWDNGKGIPEEYIPRLFERFFRVDSGRSRKKGGTGLGLPIVKTTVLTLGGTISARNRKDGGLEFVFTLPVWSDDDDE